MQFVRNSLRVDFIRSRQSNLLYRIDFLKIFLRNLLEDTAFLQSRSMCTEKYLDYLICTREKIEISHDFSTEKVQVSWDIFCHLEASGGI